MTIVGWSAIILVLLLTGGVAPGHAEATPAVGSSLAITVEAYNTAQVEYLASSAVAPLLQPGDTVYVGGEGNNSGTASDENAWQSQLAACAPSFAGCVPLPAGVSYVGQSPALETGVAHGGLDAGFAGVSADYEPDIGAAFNWSFSYSLNWIATHAAQAHADGLAFHAYPTGQGLGYKGTQNGWNYAQFVTVSGADYVDAQTQGYASCGNMSSWDGAIRTLDGQFAAAGVPLSRLTIQLSLGDGCWDGSPWNGVDPGFAVRAIQDAQALGNTRFFLWWQLSNETWLPQVLGNVTSSSTGADPTPGADPAAPGPAGGGGPIVATAPPDPTGEILLVGAALVVGVMAIASGRRGRSRR